MTMSTTPPAWLITRRCFRTNANAPATQPVSRDERQRTRHPAEADGDEDERDAEPEAVEDLKERPASGRPLGVGERIDRPERRGEAGGPRQAETEAEQR